MATNRAHPPSDPLHKALLAARARNRAIRQATRSGGRGLSDLLAPRMASEHFHLVYHLPREGLSIPYYKDVLSTVHDAFGRLHALGKQAEPQTEWYDDGTIGFETSLAGRLGKFWVVVQVTGCVLGSCQVHMSREQHRQKFTLLTDETPIPLEEVPEDVPLRELPER